MDDCYRMWEPEKNYVYVTCDVLWLKRIHFNKANLLTNYPIRNIEISYSAARKSDDDNNVTADASNERSAEQNEALKLNSPSAPKVTIGGEKS